MLIQFAKLEVDKTRFAGNMADNVSSPFYPVVLIYLALSLFLAVNAASLLTSLSKFMKRKRRVRVYVDGCFDLTHFGHANALRQAKMLGDELVVGLVADREILKCKGPPLLNESERQLVLQNIKWVDEVITGVPYDLSTEFVMKLFTEHRIDFIVHGDDPCLLPDGTDAYAAVKRAGKFKLVQRTEGVSTTDIIERMLLASSKSDIGAIDRRQTSYFCTTSQRIAEFSNVSFCRPEGSRTVYVHGDFDIFHAGHIEFLRKAKSYGDVLLVGLHNDISIRERRGPKYPIFSVQERSLCLLACKVVDDVVIGVPDHVTRDIIVTLKIDCVLSEKGVFRQLDDVKQASLESQFVCDPDEVPKSMGIFREVQESRTGSAHDELTSDELIERVASNRSLYEKRNLSKCSSEAVYYETKHKSS